MTLYRRSLLLGAVTLPVAGAVDVPSKSAKVVKLFRSPDGHPNALEATREGLWVGEQTTDRAYLLNWKTGKVIKKVETESSNTSGIAYGGGYLWMAANGKAIGRPPRSADATSGEVVKVDPATGRTVARYPVPDGGGIHGIVYVDGTLWLTCMRWKELVQVDAESFKILHRIPDPLPRPHGLAWDPPGIWVVHSTDYLIQKLHAKSGRVLEQIQLVKGRDPDPHGMDIYQGKLYYCDAGIAPPGVPNQSPHSGWICRLDVS